MVFFLLQFIKQFETGLCVMYPAVVMIAGTAKKEWKYSPPIPWCWWTTSGMEWGLFYSCLIVCSLASCVCIMFVLFELRNVSFFFL